MNVWLQAAMVCVITIVVDIVWAIYIDAVAHKKYFHAASASSLIVLLGSITVLAYINNPLMVFASATGAFIGTYIMVRHKK